MLQYLWIPSLVVVGLFVLALCFYFYSEYDCCICRRRVPKPGSLPNDVELEAVVSLKDDWRQSSLADKENVASGPSPDDIIQFKFGPKASKDLFKLVSGIPTLDLHGLTAEEARELTRSFLRAHSSRPGNPLATGGGGSFLHGGTLATGQPTGEKTVMIITGRGVHSQGGIPIIKPVVENILRQRNLKFTVTSKGGAFTVEL